MKLRAEEWIKEPDEEGKGLLKALVGEGVQEIPLPVALSHVAPDTVAFGTEQEFELLLACTERPKVYRDEAAFHAVLPSLDPESLIPIGLFPAPDEEEKEDFVPDPVVYLNGRVVQTYEQPELYGFNHTDVLYTLACQGNEYDCVLLPEDSFDEELRVGDIVSGIYVVSGICALPDSGGAE